LELARNINVFAGVEPRFGALLEWLIGLKHAVLDVVRLSTGFRCPLGSPDLLQTVSRRCASLLRANGSLSPAARRRWVPSGFYIGLESGITL